MKDYSAYNTYQSVFSVPLTYIFYCLYIIVFSYIDGSGVQIWGWIPFATAILAPILILPSLIVGALIAWIVRKMQLCRNKKDILISLLITFAVYSVAGIIVFIVMLILFGGEFDLKGFFIYYFMLFFPASLCACLTSWVFSRFLPTEIVNNTDK